ncbi:MAG: hypothetical protein HRT88_04565 [Lentisphaeraceae bacterium]|nr:hypothetical protein [Lentisphaeraceae bacterium]
MHTQNFKHFLITALLMNFICGSLIAQETKKPIGPKQVFKAFVSAYFDHDLKTMQKVAYYDDEMKVLLEMPQLKGADLSKAKTLLKGIEIFWHIPGDLIKLQGGNITVNDQMSNTNKRIGTIRHLDFVYPLSVRKSRRTGLWKVDAMFAINSIARTVRRNKIRDMKDYRIFLDGQVVHLDEEEEGTITDKEGKKHTISLFRNEVQQYKDGRVHFQYHKEMSVFPNKMKDGFIYTLTSQIGAEIHILVYDKGVNLIQARQKYIDLWIENYTIKKALFEQQRLKKSSQEINSNEVAGSIMYVRQENKVIYNQFYFFEDKGRTLGLFARGKNFDTSQINLYLKIASKNIGLTTKVK